ncbi:uncharacterized protein LOC117335119 [Pecten maximus]|uniref:uncharacterized protein LOC117335119 n=1 Tax=Pecten maximus TaxID=6579 RepID=UPI001458E49F|nr:uncharacterized protein LOC117335119 [Pecten maximus]
MESSLDCPDKLSVADKNTHNTEKPNDPHHLADKLKEVVSKISSGRKRRKSAVLLDSQPITPDAKRRRLSKEKELDSYGSCSKSVRTIDKNVQEQNSVVAKSCVMDDKSKDAGEYCEKSSGGFVVLPNTYNASISDSRNTLSSKEPSHHSSSSSSVNTSATEMHKDKALETEVATDDDLPKIVRSARLRKVRVSKRPWLMKTKETNVAESQSETEDPEGFVNKSEEESNNSKGPCMEKSKEKKKSEIEKCQERTKSLRLELRRISFPPTSLKNLDSKSNETDTAMVKQGPEKEKESGKRNLNKGFDMEGLGKAVSGQQSAETELECMEKYGGSVNDNMNNNSSIVSREGESTSTIIPWIAQSS